MTKCGVAVNPPFSSASAVRVIQLTDPHLFAAPSGRLLNVDTDESLRGVLQHIIRQHDRIDLLLATGDITQDGSTPAYRRFLELAAQVPAPLRGLPGNHDIRKPFYDAWGDHAQAITDMGAWRVVLLDSSVPNSNAGHLAPAQLQLLKTAALQADGRHVLVALHHNPVPVGSAWLDTMMVDNHAELFQVLQGLPQVRGLLWGHVHQEYDDVHVFRAAIHSVRLMATPSTCIQFTPRSAKFSLDTRAPGYRWLQLLPDGRIETGVGRAIDVVISPDPDEKGY